MISVWMVCDVTSMVISTSLDTARGRLLWSHRPVRLSGKSRWLKEPVSPIWLLADRTAVQSMSRWLIPVRTSTSDRTGREEAGHSIALYEKKLDEKKLNARL